MKKMCMKLSIVLLVFILAAGCALPGGDSQGTGKQTSDGAMNYEAKMNRKYLAVSRAYDFLKSELVLASNAEWAAKANISNAFPLYIDGAKDAAYYECKVSIDGKDGGYILVNVNRMDAPVPEYKDSGPTITEKIAGAAGLSPAEINIYRYNWFEFAAEKSGTVRSKRNIIAELGITPGGKVKTGEELDRDVVRQRQNELRSKIARNGGVLMTDRKELETIYSDQFTRGTTRTRCRELVHRFKSGNHLPMWDQVKFNLNGQKVLTGCTPLAFAMCYAYWKQFKGKSRLFNGANLYHLDTPAHSNNSIVLAAVREIGIDLETRYSSVESTTRMGRRLESLIDNYGDRRLYSFDCDVDFGSEWNKGMNAYERIGKDMPMALSIDTDRDGKTNHTTAVEGVKYLEKKNLLIWHPREMWYLLNYGWGEKNKWVCTYARFNDRQIVRDITGVYHFWD